MMFNTFQCVDFFSKCSMLNVNEYANSMKEIILLFTINSKALFGLFPFFISLQQTFTNKKKKTPEHLGKNHVGIKRKK